MSLQRRTIRSIVSVMLASSARAVAVMYLYLSVSGTRNSVCILYRLFSLPSMLSLLALDMKQIVRALVSDFGRH